MIIKTIPATNCTPQTIVIGRRGTYDTLQIAFDLAYLIENYGNGTAVLAIKRSQDESAYPAVVTQEDATLLWTVSETDTAYVGSGECQLMWYVDGGLAKTIIYPMVVMRDILQTAEQPPDGYENWIEHLTELGAETQQNAQNAAQSASDASTAKDDAVTAKEAAEEAVVHAPIIQNGYWYIWNDGQYVDTGVRAEGQKGDKGDTGEKGDTGNGIASITKTGTSGLVDTYTVTYTDGTTTTFTVTNGAVSSVNGKTGAVNLASGDIAYDESATYQAGSVGAELQEQNRHLSDLEDTVSTTQIINTASGAIASFSDGADNMPIRKLVAQIEPVQDLHGQDSPYPPGGGKNLLEVVNVVDLTSRGITQTLNLDGTVTVSGTANTIVNLTAIITANGSNRIYLPVGRYKFVDTVVNGGRSFYYYLRNSENTTWSESGAVFEITDTESYCWIIFYAQEGATVSGAHGLMILRESETDLSWHPYSNICPISGHTGAEIEQTGVNVWDEEWENGTFDTTTGANINTGAAENQIRAKNLIPIKPSATYYFKDPSGIWCIFYDANKNVITPPAYDRNVIAHDGNSLFLGDAYRPASVTFTMPSNAYFMKFYCQNVYGSTYNNDISINYPVTATAYEPYTGNQISVTFPTTIYGGKDEVITGKLKSTMAMVDMGTLNWTYASSGERSLFTSFDLANRYKPSGVSSIPVNAMFECYLNVAMNSTFKNGEAGLDGNISSRIVVCDNRYTDADSFKAAMSGIHLCYELAEPVEYTLTENEVETLYGTNNIWSSTGDTEVEYPCDTKLYIDGKLAELQATILENIGG